MHYDDGLAVAQQATDYLLRVIAAANRNLDGDLTMGAVLIGVINANLGAQGAEPGLVSGGQLAARLGIPNETVRRKVKTLIDIGYLVREDGGLKVQAHVFARPDVAQVLSSPAPGLLARRAPAIPHAPLD